MLNTNEIRVRFQSDGPTPQEYAKISMNTPTVYPGFRAAYWTSHELATTEIVGCPRPNTTLTNQSGSIFVLDATTDLDGEWHSEGSEEQTGDDRMRNSAKFWNQANFRWKHFPGSLTRFRRDESIWWVISPPADDLSAQRRIEIAFRVRCSLIFYTHGHYFIPVCK